MLIDSRAGERQKERGRENVANHIDDGVLLLTIMMMMIMIIDDIGPAFTPKRRAVHRTDDLHETHIDINTREDTRDKDERQQRQKR